MNLRKLLLPAALIFSVSGQANPSNTATKTALRPLVNQASKVLAQRSIVRTAIPLNAALSQKIAGLIGVEQFLPEQHASKLIGYLEGNSENVAAQEVALAVLQVNNVLDASADNLKGSQVQAELKSKQQMLLAATDANRISSIRERGAPNLLEQFKAANGTVDKTTARRLARYQRYIKKYGSIAQAAEAKPVFMSGLIDHLAGAYFESCALQSNQDLSPEEIARGEEADFSDSNSQLNFVETLVAMNQAVSPYQALESGHQAGVDDLVLRTGFENRIQAAAAWCKAYVQGECEVFKKAYAPFCQSSSLAAAGQ